MEKIQIDFSRTVGKIKPMHAVNNGPVRARSDQTMGNFELYREADIPFARNHDASFFDGYGGPYTVDVHMIFPDFDADPENPENYDFIHTDHYLKDTLDAGTQIFYRLGSKIEHTIKKYGTLVPKDFHKWAVICEHIIRHYNEGWGNGFHFNILYWEIWNEPDLDTDDSTNKRCWGGTAQQYYELYEVAATYLKACFPELKIGGPALAFGTGVWTDRFLAHLTRDGKRVPLDFFSWHWYGTEPEDMLDRARLIRTKLDRAGYTDSESILNEWNYVAGWGAEWIDSIRTMISIKGAAFVAACMCAGQNDPAVDMLMYYDAQPCRMNGMFDYYTYAPLKGYYAIKNFSVLYRLGEQAAVRKEGGSSDIYTAAARNAGGDAAAVISYYSDDAAAAEKRVELGLEQLDPDSVEMYLTNGEKDCEKTDISAMKNGWQIVLQPNTFLLIKGKLKI